MGTGLRRREDMEQTLTAPATQIPDELAEVFERLYRDCRDDLYGYVAGMLRDRAAAEDVTALAFERAFRRRRSFDPKRGTRRAWLFGIARNAALDELRRRKRQAELADDVVDPDTPDPAEGAEAAMRRTALREAMGQLNARERELVGLKFFAGLSNTEIATVTGTSESNAGTQLHRALEKLRRALR